MVSEDYSDSQNDGSSSVSSTYSDQQNIAKNAINGAIDAQSDSSSKDTMKPSRAEYTSIIMPNNHLKLTKLKREINHQKTQCENLVEQNKVKAKEKKSLQEKLIEMKAQLERLLKGKPDNGDFQEQKATSTRFILGKYII